MPSGLPPTAIETLLKRTEALERLVIRQDLQVAALQEAVAALSLRLEMAAQPRPTTPAPDPRGVWARIFGR